MKIYAITTFLLGLMYSSHTLAGSEEASKIVGDWQGDLKVSAQSSMQLIVHIKKSKEGYQASFDVPAQQQYGLTFNDVKVDHNSIDLKLAAANIHYSATLKNDKFIGTYTQGGFKAPLNLSKTQQKIVRKKKPQEPTNTVAYNVEQVTFENQNGGHELSGTLTYPNGEIKSVAILLSGSGPTTRDGDVFGHKIYLVLADQLTRNGIAVLRYDDRGVDHSGGDYAIATSADFASDANAAFEYLKKHEKFKKSKIGFIGHSEGGLIGAIAAANNSALDFFVSLAGPGTSGAQILIDQSYYIQELRGVDKNKLASDDKTQKAIMSAIENGISESDLVALLIQNKMSKEQALSQAKQLTSPWFEYFIRTDPKQFLAQLSLPVLALNGELDAQVLANKNITGIKEAVNPVYLTTKVYQSLNHLFQPAKTGLPNEYGQIETTFSEQVSDDIVQWLNKQ